MSTQQIAEKLKREVNGENRSDVVDDLEGILSKNVEELTKNKFFFHLPLKNIFSIIAALPSLPAINRLKKAMDYKSYGGALFLGVKKPVVKAHGSSDEILFEFTIKQAEKFVENRAVEKMIEEFEKTDKN